MNTWWDLQKRSWQCWHLTEGPDSLSTFYYTVSVGRLAMPPNFPEATSGRFLNREEKHPSEKRQRMKATMVLPHKLE